MDKQAINSIIRSYNAMLSIVALRRILENTPYSNINKLSKSELHSIVAEIFDEHFYGEGKIKSLLVDHFRFSDAIAGFEYKIGASRADFLRVNKKSYCYEIKSEADSLYKLNKQAQDYVSAFEYNSIVIDKKHYELAMDIVPDTFGIYLASQSELKYIRKAKLNKYICSSCQLSAFNKKELLHHFGKYGQYAEEILSKIGSKQINDAFKLKCKNRYARKWSFLLKNIDLIHSVDYQFFMSRNIDPDKIYHTSKVKFYPEAVQIMLH